VYRSCCGLFKCVNIHYQSRPTPRNPFHFC
jgi:hypothetical protein